jgi:hypothetical protein
MDDVHIRAGEYTPRPQVPSSVNQEPSPGLSPSPSRPPREVIEPKKTKERRSRGRFLKKLIIGIIILALFIIAGTVISKQFASSGPQIDTSKYQAVFLTSGQVYFGKLQNSNGDYLTLTNVFYLQAKTDTSTAGNPQKASPSNANDVELIKLGNEIHGPEDKMVISHAQVLFYENLKSDGRVSQSIANYK